MLRTFLLLMVAITSSAVAQTSFPGGTRSTPYLGQVATRSNIPMNFTAAIKQQMNRTTHFARTNITSLQIAIPNWYVNVNASPEEVATGATASVTASIEYPAGATPTRVNFSGATTGTIASGATLISDPTTITIPNGSTFFVRIWFSNSAGVPQIVYAGNGMMASDGTIASTTTTPDLTNVGGSIANSGTIGFFPAAIIGQTVAPSVCIFSDSRAQGVQDTANSNGDLGEFARSIGPSMAYINMSASGDQMAKVMASHALRFPLTSFCSTVITSNGLNDLVVGLTAAQLAASTNQFIALFPPSQPVWISTFGPWTTSTDAWSTLTNQTPTATNGVRISFNDMVRACGAGPLVGMKGCIDIASVTESSLNSGLWRVLPGGAAITLDGVHEYQNGAILIKSSGIVPVASSAR